MRLSASFIIPQAALGLLALAAAACGASSPQPAKVPVSAQSAPREPGSLPEVPSDPRLLIPAGATEYAIADLESLRDSPHFPMLREWATRYACLSAPRAGQGPASAAGEDAPAGAGQDTQQMRHWLLDDTRELVAASFGANAPENRPRVLFVLRGQYGDDAAKQALRELVPLLAPSLAGAPEQREPRGRFELVTRGAVGAVQLRDDLFALGHRETLDAVLALADGKRTDRFVDSALHAGHAQEGALQDHTLALLALPSPGYRAALSQQLSSIGARKLLQGVREGSLLATVDVGDDVEVAVDADYDTPASATQAADAARQLYFQGNLLLRLTGMPRVFDRAQAAADGVHVRYTLDLRQDDIQRLRERLEWLLQAAREERCPANP